MMSQVSAVENLVPHRCSSNLGGVAVPSSRSRIRCSATTGTNLKPHSAVVDKQRAAVLAIGTANPTNCIPQDEYADWYFRVTKTEHLARLKRKMKKICENNPNVFMLCP
jgi:metal-dependent amidase/aminoacylase/carboxypeptidase family protein